MSCGTHDLPRDSQSVWSRLTEREAEGGDSREQEGPEEEGLSVTLGQGALS